MSDYPGMVYTMENGARVATEGPICIEGVRHRVRECYVFCDSGLNNKSWNTTEERSICRICYPDEDGQLDLFGVSA